MRLPNTISPIRFTVTIIVTFTSYGKTLIVMILVTVNMSKFIVIVIVTFTSQDQTVMVTVNGSKFIFFFSSKRVTIMVIITKSITVTLTIRRDFLI